MSINDNRFQKEDEFIEKANKIYDAVASNHLNDCVALPVDVTKENFTNIVKDKIPNALKKYTIDDLYTEYLHDIRRYLSSMLSPLSGIKCEFIADLDEDDRHEFYKNVTADPTTIKSTATDASLPTIYISIDTNWFVYIMIDTMHNKEKYPWLNNMLEDDEVIVKQFKQFAVLYKNLLINKSDDISQRVLNTFINKYVGKDGNQEYETKYEVVKKFPDGGALIAADTYEKTSNKDKDDKHADEEVEDEEEDEEEVEDEENDEEEYDEYNLPVYSEEEFAEGSKWVWDLEGEITDDEVNHIFYYIQDVVNRYKKEHNIKRSQPLSEEEFESLIKAKVPDAYDFYDDGDLYYYYRKDIHRPDGFEPD